MPVFLLIAFAFLPSRTPDAFSVQTNLQSLYDEISQATLQFDTASDVDEFHAVLYSPDWVFIDEKGEQHTWEQMREQEVAALSQPRLDSMMQSIQKVKLTPDGATTTVTLVTVRTAVDEDGKYGAKGKSHTFTETTRFRDAWVNVQGSWKLKSREQTGHSQIKVDRPELSGS